MASEDDSPGAAAEHSRLRSALRREKADIAALQADIASAAVAFQRGKGALEVALQTPAAGPPFGAPSSPRHGAPAEEEDGALARSLQAQISATRDGLARLQLRERALLAEVNALSAAAGARGSAEGGQPAGGGARSVGAAMQRLHAAADAVRRGDAGTGEAGDWREHSLPNLSLTGVKVGEGGTPMSGVVVDRVFDGIVAFTAGRDRMVHSASTLMSVPSASKDHEIVSCAAELAKLDDEALRTRVASGYSSMTVEDATGTALRIVSLAPTLDCVRRLLQPHVAAAKGRESAWGSDPAGVPVIRVPELKKASSPRSLSPASPPRGSAFPSEATPRLSHSSRCISDVAFGRVLQAAPVRYHDCDLQRLYCTDTDGISMVTLLKKVAGRSPVFIVVRDTSGHAFGCYGPAAWRDSCKTARSLLPSLAITFWTTFRPAFVDLTLFCSSCDMFIALSGTRSYGSGESFVFKLDGHMADIFKWTRANSFFQISSHEHLAIGGGGHFALWIDGELAHGTTADCSTFDNPPLTPGRGKKAAATARTPIADTGDDDMVDFEIIVVEAWAPVLRGHLEGD